MLIMPARQILKANAAHELKSLSASGLYTLYITEANARMGYAAAIWR